MVKYLINDNIHGYERVSLKENKFADEQNNLIVIIIDKSCDNNLGDYYRLLDKCLRNLNRIILISIKDENKSFKPLASLLVTFNDYDIYTVADRNAVSAKLLEKAEQRHPDYNEVQEYIGGDISAFADLSNIIYGIESIINEGNIDGLKSFIEEHMVSIENLTSTLNFMKKTCDIFNSDELIDEINKLKKDIEGHSKKVDELNKIIDDTKSDRDKYKADSENLKIKIDSMKDTNEQLKLQNESAGSVIHSYKDVNTQMLKCKAKIVVYFKEISPIPYMNSLISNLISYLDMQKLSNKLLIYDMNAGIYDMYKPLQIVTGKEFDSQKDTLINKTPRFVVAEPNQMILESILLSEKCFDVVIIYDRLRGYTDIVSGNNVTKFYIINSAHDFDMVSNKIKLTDTSFLITHVNSSLIKDSKRNIKKTSDGTPTFLDIPYIEDYTKSTESARVSKYLKLATQQSKLPLIKTIIEKSRINTLK